MTDSILHDSDEEVCVAADDSFCVRGGVKFHRTEVYGLDKEGIS